MRFALRVTMFVLAGALLASSVYRMAIASPADVSDEAQIRSVIEMQAGAWNRGDLDTFMTAYWKSDQTAFVGANGITRGWQAVLDRYRTRYPDAKAMGHLSFANLEIHTFCPDAAFVIGQFQLERENDKPAGIFTLDFKKFPDGWKIIVDHSTAFPATAH
jgi:ketosteroid isomerase-like protein